METGKFYFAGSARLIEPSVSINISCIVWLAIAAGILFAILHLLKRPRLSSNESDLPIRALERFKFTHKEVFPLLSRQEMKDMLIVFNNTVHNAMLFKKKKYFAKLEKNSPRKLNKDGKRVCFRFEV